MAVSLDTTVSAVDTSVSSVTLSLTVAANSNRGLIVATVITGTPSPQVVSTVTYNGVGLSSIGAVGVSDGDNIRVELWKLVAPATGAHDIVVTFDAVCSNVAIAGYSVYDADQTTFVRAAASRTGGTTPETSSSLTPTSAVGDLVIDAIGFRYVGQGTLTVGAGQTSRWTEDTTRGAGSTEPGSASTTTMSWSWATGGWTASSQMAVAVIPAAPPARPDSFYRMMRAA